MQIQPFSVNDGEGIRTNIFMAGCPLRCRWCSNPEGFAQKELIGWYSRKCIGCAACESVCPQGIGIDMTERDRCIACGACVNVCPEEARTRMVSLIDADDVIKEVLKHRLFYSYSGGGVTFSGGEATSQPEFLEYVSRELYDSGISIDIESCGYFDFDLVRDGAPFKLGAKGLWFLINWTLQTVSVFLLGALIFKKGKIAKTILTLFLISMVSSMITAAIASSIDPDSMMTFIETWAENHLDKLDLWFNLITNASLVLVVGGLGLWSWFKVKNLQH